MKKTLNVLQQSNDGYAAVCAISIVSLLENNKHLDEINIYYLGYDLSAQSIERLNKLTDSYINARLIMIDAEPYHNELKRLGVRPWRGIYVTWLKLLALKDLRINTDNILYLNAHTIVNSALDELIDFDLGDAVMGLSYDCILNEHKLTLGLKESDGYFNCGVMLINYKKWLTDNIGDDVVRHLKEKKDYVIVDQDFCNVLFKNKIQLISSTYNYSSAYYGYDLKRLLKVNNLSPEYFYSYEELMEEYYYPKIVHSLYGIQGKPWELNNKHPQRFLWAKYIELTPWKLTEMPKAKYSLNWFLYDILPSAIFMQIYKFAVSSKYATNKRNKFIIMIFELLTPQKGT